MADQQQRGRSPSAGHQSHIRHTPSPSPHNAFRQSISASATIPLDPSLANTNVGQFGNNFSSPLASATQSTFDPNDFLNTSQSQPQSQGQYISTSDNSFLHAQNSIQTGHHSPSLNPVANGFSSDFLDPNDSNDLSFGNDPQLFESSDYLDPQLLGSDQPQNQSIDPNDLMNQMTTHHHSPTPPHMLQADMSRHSSASPHISPSMTQAQFPPHSRNTSLDPSSAAFPHGINAGWGEGQQFRGHRRAQSDAHSDVSSNFNSPYLGSQDNFDNVDHHSPLLPPQPNDAVFAGGIALETLNFNDPQQHNQQHMSPQHISPIPSPHHSPRVGAQQSTSVFNTDNPFGLAANSLTSQYGMTHASADMFPGQDSFPTMNHIGSGGMSPPDIPDINIMPAPPSRQASFEPPKPEGSEDALSPPDRRSPRPRALSDPYAGSGRAASPHNGNEGISHARNSLSPNSARAISRSPSPSRGGSAGNRRSSTSSVPNRNYILDLADPSRPTSGLPGDSTTPGRQRTQKHPATFQCSLCPKRFTRAYNLRSHLRTHTDERPFVCNVCGKAFARQHDRKRHEGLHSGEKRFVCRGHLKTGDSWGCGRKFARADALGRHFRSEAGRVCIKPLLEEEAAEKGVLDPGMNAQSMQGAVPGMMPGGVAMVPGMPVMGMPMDQGYAQQPAMMQYQLPQRLFQQFPMLAGIQWDQLPAGNDDMDDISGRSSFDASSGGEMDDHDDQGAPYGSGAIANQGWASDTGY